MKKNQQKNKNRVVVFDAEFTGLDVENDDRIISVGLVEVFNNKAMGKKKDWIINPDGQQSHPRALKIHGLTDEFLKTHPLFYDVAQEILDFIDDDIIVHHCWYGSDDYSTDEIAMNTELVRAGFEAIPHHKWLNMKKWAQAVSPCGNSLDQMLDLYKIDRSARAKHHGALIDAKLTAKVYKKMAPVFRPQ